MTPTELQRLEEIEAKVPYLINTAAKKGFAWLIAQIREAQVELNRLDRLKKFVDDDGFGNEYAIVCHFKNEMETMRDQLRIATEALEFYAKHENWLSTTHESTWDGQSCGDFDQIKNPQAYGLVQVAGKRARAALAQIRKGEGEQK